MIKRQNSQFSVISKCVLLSLLSLAFYFTLNGDVCFSVCCWFQGVFSEK